MKFALNIASALLIGSLLLVDASAQVRKVEMVKSGGVYRVPCIVNALPMQFIFDTGASGIALSREAVEMMVAKGAIVEDDVLGSEYYRIANGDVVEGVIVRLRSFEIGGVRIKDITASVSLSLEAPLLLGTDILERFGKVTIDYSNGLLLLGEEEKPFLEELDKIYRLHKYMWDTPSEAVEQLETSEKYRVKLVTGSFTEWKSVSRFDGSLSMSYKERIAGLALSKLYSFKEEKLDLEMVKVLREGLAGGNPDMEYRDLSPDVAYRLYAKLDSLVAMEANLFPTTFCIGESAYACVHNTFSDVAAYNRFFDSERMPMDLTNVSNFQTNMAHLLQDMRTNGEFRADVNLHFIRRRPTFNNDGYYDLCVSTSDAMHYDVWLVIRKK